MSNMLSIRLQINAVWFLFNDHAAFPERISNNLQRHTLIRSDIHDGRMMTTVLGYKSHKYIILREI